MKNVLRPFRLKFFYRAYRHQTINLLDVGCGSHAPTVTKRWMPACNYYGIDRENYNNDEADFAVMTAFYKIDLAVEPLDSVPDNFFDVVIMSHVIEHLPNGLKVVEALIHKLKPGGECYIEFPSVRSLSFPSMKGSLNFCDDPTHVRVYSIQEIANVLLQNGMKITRAGVRRDTLRLLLSPFLLPIKMVLGRFMGGDLWDILGFAEYVYAVKRGNQEGSSTR